MTRINDNGIDREMTPSELAAHKIAAQEIQADSAALEAALEAKAIALASARAKLAALGLTEAEIKALVG